MSASRLAQAGPPLRINLPRARTVSCQAGGVRIRDSDSLSGLGSPPPCSQGGREPSLSPAPASTLEPLSKATESTPVAVDLAGPGIASWHVGFHASGPQSRQSRLLSATAAVSTPPAVPVGPRDPLDLPGAGLRPARIALPAPSSPEAQEDALLRNRRLIENRLHNARDFRYDEDRCRSYVRDLPRKLAWRAYRSLPPHGDLQRAPASCQA